MRPLLLAILAAAALAALPAAANAACAPQTQSIADPVGDAFYGQSPDITSVTVSVDAACTLTFTDGLANRPALTQYDDLQWGMDVDNNAATGRSSGDFAGDEYAVILSGTGTAVLADGNGQKVADATALPFGAAIPMGAVGATETSTIRISSNAITVPPGHFAFYWDDAPDLVLHLSPAPVAPTPPPGPTTTAPAAPPVQCVVPTLTGKTLADARTGLVQAHCGLGAVHRHKARGKVGVILASTPKAGTTSAAGTKVAVVVRSRP